VSNRSISRKIKGYIPQNTRYEVGEKTDC